MENDNHIYLVDSPDSKLVVWKDNNYFETLEKGHKKRDIEKKAIAEILNSIDKDLVLKNKPNGAPYILHSSYTYISISHYGGYYALYLSNKAVGVDIQTFKDSLKKGKHYFVNETDESDIELSKINLHLIWTAKEAFYKKISGKTDDLKNEVSILEIDELGKLIRLKYREEIFALNFAVFEAYVVTWT